MPPVALDETQAPQSGIPPGWEDVTPASLPDLKKEAAKNKPAPVMKITAPKGYVPEGDVKPPAGYTQDGFTLNPKGEGLYRMGSYDFQKGAATKPEIQVPFSRIQDALTAGYKLHPDEEPRYQHDVKYQGQGPTLWERTKGAFAAATEPMPDTALPQYDPEHPVSSTWYRANAALGNVEKMPFNVVNRIFRNAAGVATQAPQVIADVYHGRPEGMDALQHTFEPITVAETMMKGLHQDADALGPAAALSNVLGDVGTAYLTGKAAQALTGAIYGRIGSRPGGETPARPTAPPAAEEGGGGGGGSPPPPPAPAAPPAGPAAETRTQPAPQPPSVGTTYAEPPAAPPVAAPEPGTRPTPGTQPRPDWLPGEPVPTKPPHDVIYIGGPVKGAHRGIPAETVYKLYADAVKNEASVPWKPHTPEYIAEQLHMTAADKAYADSIHFPEGLPENKIYQPGQRFVPPTRSFKIARYVDMVNHGVPAETAAREWGLTPDEIAEGDKKLNPEPLGPKPVTPPAQQPPEAPPVSPPAGAVPDVPRGTSAPEVRPPETLAAPVPPIPLVPAPPEQQAQPPVPVPEAPQPPPVPVTPPAKGKGGKQKTVSAMIAEFMKRAAMEAQGQDILDEMIANKENPSDIEKTFWSDTYFKLPGNVQKRFQQMLKAVSGMQPGDYIGNDKDGNSHTAKTWMDIANHPVFGTHLGDDAEYLEGPDRGYAVLMREANRALAGVPSKAQGGAGAAPAPQLPPAQTPEPPPQAPAPEVPPQEAPPPEQPVPAPPQTAAPESGIGKYSISEVRAFVEQAAEYMRSDPTTTPEDLAKIEQWVKLPDHELLNSVREEGVTEKDITDSLEEMAKAKAAPKPAVPETPSAPEAPPLTPAPPAAPSPKNLGKYSLDDARAIFKAVSEHPSYVSSDYRAIYGRMSTMYDDDLLNKMQALGIGEEGLDQVVKELNIKLPTAAPTTPVPAALTAAPAPAPRSPELESALTTAGLNDPATSRIVSRAIQRNTIQSKDQLDQILDIAKTIRRMTPNTTNTAAMIEAIQYGGMPGLEKVAGESDSEGLNSPEAIVRANEVRNAVKKGPPPPAAKKPRGKKAKAQPEEEPGPSYDVAFARVEGGKVKLGADAEALGKVLGSSLYGKDKAEVITKELLQNAMDAIRKTKGVKEVTVEFNTYDHTITITDTGNGMTRHELETVFTDLGASGKRDDATASGGFGIAKAAPLMMSEKLTVTTISKEKGKFYRHTFEATPVQLLNEGVEIKTEELPQSEGLQTGTVIESELDPDVSFHAAKGFAEKSRNSIRLPGKLVVKGGSGWHDDVPKMKRTASTAVPGANIDIYTSPGETKELGSYPYIEVDVNNNGIFQFTHGMYPPKEATGVAVPKRISIDIRASVPEGDGDYPFTANRESLRGPAGREIGKLITEKIIRDGINAHNKKVAAALENLPSIKIGALEIPILDSGKRMKDAELKAILSDPAVIDLAFTINRLTKEAIAALAAADLPFHLEKLGKKIRRVGLVFSNDVHGVHITDPVDKSKTMLFVNPFAGIKDNASRAASLIWHTIKHEIVHDEVSGHTEDFTKAEGVVSAALGGAHETRAIQELEDVYGDPTGEGQPGRVRPDLGRTIQLYAESRERPEVTPDIFRGEGLNRILPTGDQEGVRDSGEGTVPGAARELDEDPNIPLDVEKIDRFSPDDPMTREERSRWFREKVAESQKRVQEQLEPYRAAERQAVEELGPNANPAAVAARIWELAGVENPWQSGMLDVEMPGPVWYLKSERVIGDKMKGPMPGPDVLKMLQNNGVGADELKWTGLDDYLPTAGKVTPDAVRNFISQNAIKVEEVRKGPEFGIKTREEWAQSEYDKPYEELDPAARRWVDIMTGVDERTGTGTHRPKYAQYQVPGGDNYREVLLTLPTRPDSEALRGLGREIDALENQMSALRFTPETPQADVVDIIRKRDDLQQRRSALIEQENRLRAKEYVTPFGTTHWDEPNILVHLRMNDRVAPDGKRLLHLEEIQSDWHQKGRRLGYQGGPDQSAEIQRLKDAHQAALQQADEAQAEVVNLSWRINKLLQEGKAEDSPEVFAAQRNMLEAEKRRKTAQQAEVVAQNALYDVHGKEKAKLPDAPFKKNWQEMALRRMIRYAAENGYDGVSWTGGQDQADRYDLSKQIDSEGIHWQVEDDGRIAIFAHTTSGSPLDIQPHPIEELPDVIGKDITKQIDEAIKRGSTLGQITGDNLKVGGEGMRGFYDKIMPDYLNKFGKKFGARVGETAIAVSPNVRIDNHHEGRFEVRNADQRWHEPPLADFATREEAEQYVASMGTKKPFQYLPITPEMRDSVMTEGVSLFNLERRRDRMARPMPMPPGGKVRPRSNVVLRETLPGVKEYREKRHKNWVETKRMQEELIAVDKDEATLHATQRELGRNPSLATIHKLNQDMASLNERRRGIDKYRRQLRDEAEALDMGLDPSVGEVRLDKDGNPTVYLNKTAMQMIRNVIRPGQEDVLLKGQAMSVGEARWLKNKIILGGTANGDEQAVYPAFMRLLDAAIAKSRNAGITVVGRTWQGIHDAIETLREELIHRWQRMRSENGRHGTHLPDDVFLRLRHEMPRPALDYLSEHNYTGKNEIENAQIKVIEAAAKIMAGKWRKMGLTKQQAVDWLARYYEEVAGQHGVQAILEVEHTYGVAREFQQELEKIYGPGAGAGQQGSGAADAETDTGAGGTLSSVERGGQGEAGGDAAGRAGRGGVDTPEFKRWFGKSKVVDENGEPLRVYHGTRTPVDFTEFSTEGPPLPEDDPFEEESFDTGSGADPTAYLGAHFAEEPSVANQFAQGAGWMKTRFQSDQPKPRIIPTYLSIQNPKDFGSEQNLRNFIYEGKPGGYAADAMIEEAMRSDNLDPDDLDDPEVEEWGKKYEDDPAFRRQQNRWIMESKGTTGENDDLEREFAQDLAREARERLKQQGHDGVRYKNIVEGGTSWIAFNPEQIKSAIGNRGTYDPNDPDILASVDREQAMETNVPVEMPTHPEFEAAVRNTPGAQITPDGLLLKAVRYQKPEQEGERAIRTGVFYLPGKSRYSSGFATGKIGYGGTQKLEGETLLRRPLFVKGAVGGKAPEAAYEAIKGKGSIKRLREEIDTVAWAGHPFVNPKVDRNEYRKKVADFLRDHGADPNMAFEIIHHSTEGNQLRYALQENVIAHAVRDAGYDSVLGFSRGKKGPFLSELFDVREQTYPSHVLTPEIHEKFLKDEDGRGILFDQEKQPKDAASILKSLRDKVAKTPTERDQFDWAAGPAVDFAESEDALDEMREGNIPLEKYILDDMVYRLGEQLQSMADDWKGTDDYPKIKAQARVAAKLAKKLEALGEDGRGILASVERKPQPLASLKKEAEARKPEAPSLMAEAIEKANARFDLLTPHEIANGLCYEWAEECAKNLPGSEVKDVDLWPHRGKAALPYHVWVDYQGKSYDAETPNGVSNWKQLPYFKEHANQAILPKLKARTFPKPKYADDEENGGAIMANAEKQPQAINWEDPPRAGGMVDGLEVTDNIPNRSSIDASVSDPEVLKGIREIPLDAEWNAKPEKMFYSPSDIKRSYALAEQIKQTGRIDPLIVRIENGEPDILEGQHRLAALQILGKKSFPALVVVENDPPDGGGIMNDVEKQPIKLEDKGDKAKLDRFMDDYNRITDPSPLNRRENIWQDKAVMEVWPFNGRIHLSMIRTVEPGKGHGTEALQALLDLADKHGVAMELNAVPIKQMGRLNKAQLKKWYQRHGFKPEGQHGDLMVRKPEDGSGIMADVEKTAPKELYAHRPRYQEPMEAESAVPSIQKEGLKAGETNPVLGRKLDYYDKPATRLDAGKPIVIFKGTPEHTIGDDISFGKRIPPEDIVGVVRPKEGETIREAMKREGVEEKERPASLKDLKDEAAGKYPGWEGFNFRFETGSKPIPGGDVPERMANGDPILYHGTSEEAANKIQQEGFRGDDLGYVGFGTRPGAVSVFRFRSGGKKGRILQFVLDKDWLRDNARIVNEGGHKNLYLIQGGTGLPLNARGGKNVIPREAIQSIRDVTKDYLEGNEVGKPKEEDGSGIMLSLEYNRDAYKTPKREYADKRWHPEETDEEARERRHLGKEWEQSALAALSRGDLTVKDAQAQDIHTQPPASEFKPLPPKLFHVTTAADAVEAEGIKPRWELEMHNAVGLGGGSDHSVSFTTDFNLAKDIEKGIKLAQRVAAGKVSVQDMVDMVNRGEGAPRPFPEEFQQALQAVIGGDKPLEAALKEEVVEQSMFGRPPEKGEGWVVDPEGYHWTGGDGVERYMRWKRPMTEKEKADSRWRVFKAFSPAREWAGGQSDPLFIFNSVDALAKVDPKQIAILHYTPQEGAMGTFEPGMKEWRVYSGQAVKLLDRVE